MKREPVPLQGVFLLAHAQNHGRVEFHCGYIAVIALDLAFLHMLFKPFFQSNLGGYMANVNDVAKCFLYLDEQNDGDGISNLKLQKLVYYAQGFHCAIFDAPLFDDTISAWTHGPVVANLYHQYKSFGSNRISLPDSFDKSVLSDDEFGLIEEVFEVFGQFSAWKLRDMTHEETPWLNHEHDAGEIPLSEIKEYFKKRIH